MFGSKDVTLQRVRELQPATLEHLWTEAELLGKIEVDHCFGEKEYRVQIRFSSGDSTLWATGKSLSIKEAITKALQEAYRFGAGAK